MIPISRVKIGPNKYNDHGSHGIGGSAVIVHSPLACDLRSAGIQESSRELVSC